jgi:hypothetical protein
MELGCIRYKRTSQYPAKERLKQYHRKWVAWAGIVAIPTLAAASYWIFEAYLSFIVAIVAWTIVFTLFCAAIYRRQEPVKPPLPLDKLPKRKNSHP